VTPFQHKAAARAEAQRLLAHLREHGAEEVEAAILQPAEELLDLYGEDIRARAFVTQDPLRGEMMLRPDFTVPVVRMHMEAGLDPARYCYLGEVFRRQEGATPRAREYLQVGFELFGGRDPAEADAEVFARCLGAARPAPAGGDGRHRAPARGGGRALHHARARRSFGGMSGGPGASGRCSTATRAGRRCPRARGAARAAPTPSRRRAPRSGLRTREESRRGSPSARGGVAPPLPAEEVALIGALLALAAPVPDAWTAADPGAGRAGPRPAIYRLERRVEALERRGVAVAIWASRAASGARRWNTTTASSSALRRGAPDLPPVATGGRYDALTRVLGAGGPCRRWAA
jgi:ATP phosphoribosyltransferase regulatory subunit